MDQYANLPTRWGERSEGPFYRPGDIARFPMLIEAIFKGIRNKYIADGIRRNVEANNRHKLICSYGNYEVCLWLRNYKKNQRKTAVRKLQTIKVNVTKNKLYLAVSAKRGIENVACHEIVLTNRCQDNIINFSICINYQCTRLFSVVMRKRLFDMRSLLLSIINIITGVRLMWMWSMLCSGQIVCACSAK